MMDKLRSLKFTKLKNKKDLLATLMLGFFPAVLIYLTNIKKSHTFYSFFDNVEQFYPWYQKLTTSLHDGYIPIWDNNVFSGHSFVGEFQAGAFYPVNIFFGLVFGSSKGIDISFLEALVILHLFIASVGFYFFAKSINISRTGALAGSIVFAYSGAIAARASAQTAIFAGLTLLPLALYFLIRYFNTKRYFYLIFCGLTLGMQILAGHIQPFYHTAILVGAFLLWEGLYGKKLQDYKIILFDLIKRSLAIGIPLILVTLPQILLSLQYIHNAYRWVGGDNPVGPGESVPYKIFAYQSIVNPIEFFNFLEPQKLNVMDGNVLYIGLIGLLLTALFVFNSELRNLNNSSFQKYKYLLLTIFVLAVFIVVGHSTFFTAILQTFPLTDKVREPGRYVIWIHFVLSLVIAYCVNALQIYKFKLSINHKIILGVLTFVGVLQVIYLIAFHTDVAFKNTIFQVALLCVFGMSILFFYNKPQINSKITLILIALSILSNFVIFLPKHDPETYPNNYFKKNAVIEYLEKEYPYYRIDVENTVMPKNIGDVYAVQTKLGHGATMHKPFFDFISYDWFSDEILDLLNIKYIATYEEKPLKLVASDGELKLYERENYYPKVFFMSQLGMSGEDIEALNQFKILEYKDHYIKYEVTLENAETVVFSEINYPGWKAYANGSKIEIKSAVIKDYTPLFRSLDLDAGTYTIEFKYLELL